MAVKFSNNAKTLLSSGITSSATSISVSDASAWPTLYTGDYSLATLVDISDNTVFEIVKVTAISSNTLTVVRGQEGTTARAFNSGDKVELRLTAGLLEQALTGTDVVKLDSLTASATASYSLAVGGVAYSPANANALIVSLNGVTQEPNSAFTVSGSTITFASALTANDSIDYIVDMAKTLDIGEPSDNTVSPDKLTSAVNLDAITDNGATTTNAVTVGNLTSTGIDDNAVSTAITIDSSQDVTFTSDAKFPDNGKAIFGAGSDLQIYHDGSNSFIRDAGTGNLVIRGTSLNLQKDGGESYITMVADGAVTLFHDNASKLATTSTGIDVTGDVNSDSVTTGTFTSTGIDDNATSTAITINSSQNVGIGTASPNALVEAQEDVTDTYSASASSAPNVHLQISNEDTTTANTMSLVGFGSRGTTTTTSQWYIGNVGMNNAYADSSFIFGHRTAGSTWSEVMRLDGSGNVGIGTTSPDSKLEVDNGNFKVQGSAAASYFLVNHNYSNDSVGIDLIRSDGVSSFTHNGHNGFTTIAGNVTIDSAIYRTDTGAGGIRFATAGNIRPVNNAGTSTDLALDIGDPSFRFNDLYLGGDASIDGAITSSGLTATLTSGYIRIQDLNSAVVSGTDMGGIEWRTADSNVSGANRITASISAIGDGTFNASDKAPTALTFATHGTSGVSPAERMRIDSSGDVGIGTTSPNASLHISQNPPVLALGSTGSSDPRLDFYDQGTTTVGASMFLDQSEDMLCLLRTASGGATDGIRIDSSGRVGIGTTSPATYAKLTVESSGLLSRSTANDINCQISTLGSAGLIQSSTIVGNSAPTLFYNGGTETMRIDSSGNVGIGTNAPSVASGSGLAIYDASASRLTLKTFASGDSSGDGGGLVLSGSTLYLEQRESDSLVFSTAATERMRISSSGEITVQNILRSTKTVAVTASTTTTLMSFNQAGGYHFVVSGSIKIYWADLAYPSGCGYAEYNLTAQATTFGGFNGAPIFTQINQQQNLNGLSAPTFGMTYSKTGNVADGTVNVNITTPANFAATVYCVFDGYAFGTRT